MVWNSVTTLPAPIVTANFINIPQPVHQGLSAVERRLRETHDVHNIALATASERLVQAGGKRVRPLICLLTAGMFNADYGRSVSLAAGVEMLHTATLVHDDLIDGAQTRRGEATLNANWSPLDTVLMGDYMFARAAKLVAETENVRIVQLFAETLMVIVNGEISQRAAKWRIDRQDYFERIYAKTGALFEHAAQAAATLGGAAVDEIKALADYGRCIGIAFQIVDDVLDFSGSAEQIGKPAGNDLRQGLFTLPAILYYEENPGDEGFRALLERGNGKDDLATRAVEKVRTSGVITEALVEAVRYAEMGKAALDRLPDSNYRDALLALTKKVTARSK